jgi:hypothetical protein
MLHHFTNYIERRFPLFVLLAKPVLKSRFIGTRERSFKDVLGGQEPLDL